MKKVAAILISAVFLISAVSCARPTTAPAPAAPAAGASTVDPSTIGWHSDDISWRKDTSPITLSLFVDYTWWPMDVWGKDEVSQYITNATGVNVDATKATTGDGTELQVMLASGSLPDMVYFARPAMDGLFQNPNVSYAYDDLFNDYAPEMMHLVDKVQLFLNTASDGKIYSIKSHYFGDDDWNDPRNLAGPGSAGLHLRKDIYDALGSPDISSIESLIDVLQKVKDQHPNMIPYLPSWNVFNVFVGASFGVVNVYNKIVFGVTQPEFYDYISIISELVQRGLLPIEAFTYGYEQFLEALRSGNVFSASYNTLVSDEENNFIQSNNLTGEWMPYDIVPTYKGVKKAATYYQSVGWSSLYITKNCKNPDRAIRFYQYLKSPEGDQTAQFGIKNEHWVERDDGYIGRTERFLTMSIEDAGVGPGYGLWCFGASGLYESILNASVALSNPEFSTSLGLQKTIFTYIERDPLIYFAIPKGGTDEYDVYGRINQYVTDATVPLYSTANESELKSAYDEMLGRLDQLGKGPLEEYMTKHYNDAVASYNEFIKNLK